MKAKEGTVTRTDLTIEFENTLEGEYIYGEASLLEKNIKGSWYQVPVILEEDYRFEDIAYHLLQILVSGRLTGSGFMAT